LVLAAAPLARAWTYADGDVILIFRDGTYDVEFDLGNISQFIGHTNGYTQVVTGWSYSLVTNTFGPDLTTNGDGVTVALIAGTSAGPATWLSSSEPNTTAYSPSASGLGNVYGTINNVGIDPKIYDVPTNSSAANSYVIRATGSGSSARYKYASYDYIVSGGTYNGIPYLGSAAPFILEQNIPGSLDFWGIQATTSTPQPPDTLVGTFSITTNGVLTFVAGPPPPAVLGIARSNGVDTVTFATQVGGNYQLITSPSLGTPLSAWPAVGGTVPGNGRNNSLNDTNSAGIAFYGVQRTP